MAPDRRRPRRGGEGERHTRARGPAHGGREGEGTHLVCVRVCACIQSGPVCSRAFLSQSGFHADVRKTHPAQDDSRFFAQENGKMGETRAEGAAGEHSPSASAGIAGSSCRSPCPAIFRPTCRAILPCFLALCAPNSPKMTVERRKKKKGVPPASRAGRNRDGVAERGGRRACTQGGREGGEGRGGGEEGRERYPVACRRKGFGWGRKWRVWGGREPGPLVMGAQVRAPCASGLLAKVPGDAIAGHLRAISRKRLEEFADPGNARAN